MRENNNRINDLNYLKSERPHFNIKLAMKKTLYFFIRIYNYLTLTQEQLNRKYHTIFGVMKQDRLPRNFLLIKMVFKFLASVVLVGVYESTLKQIGALFGIYDIYVIILCI